MITTQSLFTPHHLVDDGDVGLDYLDHDVADVLADICVNWSAVVMVTVHGDGCLHGLKQRLLVDAGEDEACVVKALGTLGRGADADGREWMAYRSEEARFFGQRAGIGDDCGSVHL